MRFVGSVVDVMGLIDAELANYGQRVDGTSKGTGYYGPLKRPDGKVSTELSIGVKFGDQEREIPLLVPGLSKGEIDYLLNGGRPTPALVQKAVDHARQRLQAGKDPFAGPGDRQ